MDSVIARRSFLTGAAALTLLPAAGRAAERQRRVDLGPATPFDFETLVERARRLAGTAYQAPRHPLPEVVQQIDYDAAGKIHYRRDHALFAEGPGAYPATFFPLGQNFPSRVRMFAVEQGQAQEILYSPDTFDMPADSVARQLPPDAGFAGFRLHESRTRDDWRTQDWAAFLGASYFRAIGALGQYGLSARGIAVDTAMPKPEEFPDFVEFYLQPLPNDPSSIMVHALLDGPSIAGAYAFTLQRGAGVVMEVDARLFLRRDIARLGIAPLTSMFWFSESNRHAAFDWRPEVHDSDGLAIWSGGGERIWRPLNNPETVVTSSFLDRNPRGFGLLQRDRSFEHYLDGVNYHLRPSLWVEPLGEWGEGSVQLVEIPTDDEIHDNIVAYWNPAKPALAGDALAYRYRLHWQGEQPYPSEGLAQFTATRTGRGGAEGTVRPEGVIKYVLEAAGGQLSTLPPDAVVAFDITASTGEIGRSFVEHLPETDRWRLVLDFTPEPGAPAELRAFLHRDGTPLTETWLYQQRPGPVPS